MAALWVDDGDRIWPGAYTLGRVHSGADAVLRSWALVMANAEDLQFIVTDVESLVDGDIATVNCTEIILRRGLGLRSLCLQPRRGDQRFHPISGRWRMWLHHASPVMISPSEGMI